ncbi:MAG: hypothetical protein Q7S02_01065 [bacterium]|nr:hypothetical protein [bacterium]
MRTKLIVVGVIAAVVLVVVSVFFKSYLFDERFARSELSEYLTSMYADRVVLGTQCTGRDTDGDGYVSCTARVRGKDSPEELLALECASDVFNSGCKPRIGVVKLGK